MATSRLSGLNLSRLMLGCVQFGLNYGIANKTGQPSLDSVRDIVSFAFEHGINCLDTAAAYGESEQVLGQVLEELGIQNQVTVITKIPLIADNLTASEVDQIVETSILRSLERLRLEVLPVCLFHNEENFVYVNSLNKYRSKGLVQHIGCSVATPEYALEIVRSGQCEAMQLPFSVLDSRFLDQQIIAEAEANGISVFTRSVFLQGLALMPREEIPEQLSEVITVLDALEKLSGMEMKELALRYVLSIPTISSVLIGVDSQEQLRQNLRIYEQGPLEPALIHAVAKAITSLPLHIVNPALWNKRMTDVPPARS